MAEESKIIINNNNSNNNNNNQAMQSFSQRGGSLNVNAQEFNFQKKGGGAQSKNQNNGGQHSKRDQQQMQWRKKGDQSGQSSSSNVSQSQQTVGKQNSLKITTSDQRHDREYKTTKKQQRLQGTQSNTNSVFEDDIDIKALQKQVSHHNQSANTLLGFYYQEEDYGSYSNTYGGPKGRNRKGQKYYRMSKNYSVQSAFKFIVRNQNDYFLNLYDPNENIEWKDVVQVIFNMINAQDVQCPICLESLPQMTVPRITKCGHIYCWPCILQYLAYEKTKGWKRCPLCNDPVYKHELKAVKVVQSKYYGEGAKIRFNLMVRNKSNIIVKDKYETYLKNQEEIKQEGGGKGESGYVGAQKGFKIKLPINNFPNQTQKEYHQTRLLRNELSIERQDILRDIQNLENEQQVLRSSHEFEKVPNVLEAIEHCQKELTKAQNPQSESQQEQNQEIIDFEEKKRRHNKKQALKKQHPQGKSGLDDELEENSQDFFYFYQSSTGENLFLHPLSFKILQAEYPSPQDYPLHFEAQVLEVNHSIADCDDKDFDRQYAYLHHLPDGAPYGFVEVDLCEIVSDQVYEQYERQVAYREKHRKRKQDREESYAGKVENIQNEKFEQIKRQAINLINTQAVNLKPGVVRNVYFDEDNEEGKQEETKEEEDKEVQEEDQSASNQESQKQKKLWNELESLIATDSRTAQAVRKDTLDGVEISLQTRKAMEAEKKAREEQEFLVLKDEDDKGVKFGQIVVMEAKAKKKKRRR